MQRQTLIITLCTFALSLMFANHAVAQDDTADDSLNKVPPISEPVVCADDAKPALLMVEGVNSKPEQFKRYSEALKSAKIYEQLEGYYMTIGDPVELLEGDWPQERFTVVARFPCKERAHQFWYSDTYVIIKELRQGAGNLRAMVYQEFPTPDRIQWNTQ